MWKRLALVSLVVMAATAIVQATVKPSLGSRVEHSTLIVVAKVVEVDMPDSAKLRQVTIEPTRILKGNLTPLPKRLTFNYTHAGEGNIGFNELRDSKKSYVMFFNLTTDKDERLQLVLSDAWFGVEGAEEADRVADLQAAVQKVLEKK